MKPEGPVFDKKWRSSCKLRPVERHEVDHMIKSHYLGKWPGVTVLSLGLERYGGLLGVIVFALPPRQTFTRYGSYSWELARLWICDSAPKNTETWVISQAIKYIKKKHPKVGTLVSYADPSVGHSGVIYLASNWKTDGRTDGERKSPRFDYACSKTGKKYSRQSHIPTGVSIVRAPRVSKNRFFYSLTKKGSH